MLNRLLAPPASRNCLDLAALASLDVSAEALSRELNAARVRADKVLARTFEQGTAIRELVQARAWVIEQLVLTAWHALIDADEQLELVAVGGFGRGELHPHSDADLLILCPEDRAVPEDMLEAFIRVLWDADLHPGHGVRTVNDCAAQARSDVTVATNLMETRLLAGCGDLYEAMVRRTQPPGLWPAEEFFAAKSAEQHQRHEQFEDTVYNLEPDLKNGPGGLRDIQMVAWVARRHFGTSTLHGLVEHGLLSEREHEQLIEARDRLWAIRWALHQLAGRAEERLLFDHQRQLAALFGYTGDGNEAVESFMQDYYRTVMAVERLNEQLLQMFEEELLSGRRHLPSARLDEHFSLHHGYLEANDEQAFVRRPSLLLELFLVLADNDQIRGVRASTIRLIREHLFLIDDGFRRDPEHLALFLALLKRPRRVYSQLERMGRYGILARLIPAYGQVTGRMQFDLFHVYTVDQHILFVVRNIRRIANGLNPEQFGNAIKVFASIERPEVLYLAALFHDIAKGRGGDHSELGASDARDFLDRLEMAEADRALVCWLVEQHLLMSMTAQRRDISDPAVVAEFAAAVGDRRHLEHLYVLTVADIAATRPKLWNSWKDSLLKDLFESTCRQLAEASSGPRDRSAQAAEIRIEALELLERHDLARDRAEAIIARLHDAVIARLDADQLAWSVERALAATDRTQVACRNLGDKGITEIFMHAPDFDGLVALAAREFDRMEINVLAARIATTSDEMSWNLFQLMDANGHALNDSDTARLERALLRQLDQRDIRPLPGRPIPRRLRPFMRRSEIRFEPVAVQTRLEIGATDRPGLLSAIAEGLLAADVRLHDARIATFGQRVEDVFMLTTLDGRALDEIARDRLEAELRRRLDPRKSEHEGEPATIGVARR
ncbi:MAG: [protein-PII] uridylyltransferase [Wenzhouxiangellaceae bacterium]|nr:[protein-PII] uridylyltransferase [Wenzhouxiangellaceae bacterium]